MNRARTAGGCILILALALGGQGFAQLDLESPKLAAPPEKQEKGSFGNINLGGLFDVRYMAVGNRAPGTMIHVDELVITANIGDNISILAEQLLPTSRLSGADDIIQDDHGFVYAIFSNIPVTPPGTAFKIGRFRFKWGIDAAQDSPTNMLYPLTRKNLGFVSDRGLELSGFLGPVDYELGVADGPEFIQAVVIDTLGNMVGTVRGNVLNNSAPLFLHLTTNASFSTALRFGISYFDGESWPYVNDMMPMPSTRLRVQMPGGMPDVSQLVYKQKLAGDATCRWRKLGLNLEYSQGRDRFADGSKTTTRGYFSRLDYTIKPQQLALAAQYDQFDDGLVSSEDERSVGGSIQIFLHEQAYLRLGYILNRTGESSRENVGFTQLYLPF
ncbi:MAG: hypothetical protein QME66_08790 [Candidatus Eisenbacteria bacterium]|nr:hypothetical protein [Candidatus Eisenbacteria bacterium]